MWVLFNSLRKPTPNVIYLSAGPIVRCPESVLADPIHLTSSNTSFRGDFNNPLLGLTYEANAASSGNGSQAANATYSNATLGFPSYAFDPQRNVYNFGSNQSIRIIFINTLGFNHPMHLHGQTMSVLAEGTGTWDGTITRPQNPQRRDTQILQADGYMVVQITADNAGVWPFHCHIGWHLSGGFLINVLLRPEALTDRKIPEVVAQSCEGECFQLPQCRESYATW